MLVLKQKGNGCNMKLSMVKQAIKESDKDTVREVLEAHSEEILEAALESGIPVNDILEAYQGEYTSDEDFARETAEQLGCVDSDAKWPNDCIDWEKAATELMYDYMLKQETGT